MPTNVSSSDGPLNSSRIVLAGATGDLGSRLAGALIARDVQVAALVRPGTDVATVARLNGMGVEILSVDLNDPVALGRAMSGAQCIVSALNGLEPVVIGAQKRLLDAAVASGVPRFIPSDFSLDFTRTRPGDNRNMDLRRRFMAMLDAAPIRAVSILNGGFLDLLEGQAPIVAAPIRRVVHFGNAHQKLDFTAKDDVAAFTAHAAVDDDAPRLLRIAGDSVSPVDLARVMSDLTGRRYTTLRVGGMKMLSGIIRVVRMASPASEAPFPAWQGMQYLRDMMSGRGKLHPLDNDRYGVRNWASAGDALAKQQEKRS